MERNLELDLQEDSPEGRQDDVEVHEEGEAPEMNNRENAVDDLGMMEIDGVRMILIRGQPGENHRLIPVPIPLRNRDSVGAVAQMAVNRGQGIPTSSASQGPAPTVGPTDFTRVREDMKGGRKNRWKQKKEALVMRATSRPPVLTREDKVYWKEHAVHNMKRFETPGMQKKLASFLFDPACDVVPQVRSLRQPGAASLYAAYNSFRGIDEETSRAQFATWRRTNDDQFFSWSNDAQLIDEAIIEQIQQGLITGTTEDFEEDEDDLDEEADRFFQGDDGPPPPPPRNNVDIVVGRMMELIVDQVVRDVGDIVGHDAVQDEPGVRRVGQGIGVRGARRGARGQHAGRGHRIVRANIRQPTAPNTRVLRSAGNEDGMDAEEESDAESDEEPVRRGRRRPEVVSTGSSRRGLRRLRGGLAASALRRRGRDHLAGSVGRRHPRGGLATPARHGRSCGGAQVNRDESSDSDEDVDTEPDEEPDRSGRRCLGGVSQNRRALPNELRALRYGILGAQQDGVDRHRRRRLRDVSTNSVDRVQRRRPGVNVTAGPAARRRRGALSNELRGLRYGILGAQQDRVGRHGRRGQAAGGANRGGHHAIGRRASRGRLAAQRGRAGAATRGSGRSGGVIRRRRGANN